MIWFVLIRFSVAIFRAFRLFCVVGIRVASLILIILVSSFFSLDFLRVGVLIVSQNGCTTVYGDIIFYLIFPHGHRVGSFRQYLVSTGAIRLVLGSWIPTEDLKLFLQTSAAYPNRLFIWDVPSVCV